MALLTLSKLDALLTIVDRELNGTYNPSKLNDGLNLCNNKNIIRKPFGMTSKGEQVDIFLLRNASGMEVEIINYGGHIRSVRVPSSKSTGSRLVDVTIGLDDIYDYEHKNRYFGCIVGRYANRICKGKFTLNDKQYSLPINNGPNALHGGINNFSTKVWKTSVCSNKTGIILTYEAKDGEEGYPGTCNVSVEYVLKDSENTLEINYRATTDSSTVVNLTNHAYFNLNGDFNPNSIANGSHLFQLNADFFTPIDATSIPLGSLQSVVNTPFDLRKLTDDLGARMEKNAQSDTQIKHGNGFDHNFVINGNEHNEQANEAKRVSEFAVVIGKQSGIKMIGYTDQPGVQLYTANFLNGSLCGKGKLYDKRCAFCLETQHFPDSPNQKTFPSTVLNKGDVFTSTTRYAFQTV